MKKNLYLLTGILTASISSALAQDIHSTTLPSVPTSSLTPVGGSSFRNSVVASLHPGSPGARPDNRADAINNTGIFSAVDQLADAPTHAGVRTVSKHVIPLGIPPIYSLSGEYNYLNTNDNRALGSDTQTHSMTLGGSVLLNGDFYLGLNYSYSATDSSVNRLGSYSNADANFASLVIAKSFLRFLSVGLAAGYGNTDYTIVGAGTRTPANMDTWSLSPFLSASYKTGALTTSLTAMYQFQSDHTTAATIGAINDDTSKYSLALRATYAATERLKLQALAKYTQVVSGGSQTPGLPDGRHWGTFGGRVSFAVTKPLEIYAAYAYDAFNIYLETHTITGGLRYTF